MVIGETDTSLEPPAPLTDGGLPFNGGVEVLSELRCAGCVSKVGEVIACTAAAVDDGGFGSSCSKRQGKYVGGGEGK